MGSMDTNYNILIIEPLKTIRELMEMLFSDAGYNVTCAVSCAKAFGVLEMDSFDLITCEVVWPGNKVHLHGFEIVEGIREMNQSVPIMLVTGFDNKERLIEAQEKYDLVGVALDPYGVDLLVENVGKIVSGVIKRVELPELISGKW